MSCWQFMLLCFALPIIIVNSAVILDDEDIQEQGLYSKSDHVNILTGRNFERKFYGRKNAQLIQFYNSYCGHCRAFSPKFKRLASEIKTWKNIIQLSVIDCFDDANNEICRDFEIMAYPTLRYVHENFEKANGNVGEKFTLPDTAEKLKALLIYKMEEEQRFNRLLRAPRLGINSYTSFSQALQDISPATRFAFIIFETVNSTTGPELALSLSHLPDITVKRVLADSVLGSKVGLNQIPSVSAFSLQDSNKTPINITPDSPTPHKLLRSIKNFLKSHNYNLPDEDTQPQDEISNSNYNVEPTPDKDIVYYSDLEKTLKNTLHTEITKFKTLDKEQYRALLLYLEILRDNFPYKGNDNLRAFLSDLTSNVKSTPITIRGSDLYTLVKNLEVRYNPYRSNESDYIACKGSRPHYRGFTCGLWELFHSLTVGAAPKDETEGPKVLRAMHGYVKHFFGCTHCSEHFQAMAARNRIFDVKNNDKAVLWLWISHNEVNLRLAGSETEDPEYPKIQFPSMKRCPECRQARGAWNLPAVYQYLLTIYGNDIQLARLPQARDGSTFSILDIGLLSFLALAT